MLTAAEIIALLDLKPMAPQIAPSTQTQAA